MPSCDHSDTRLSCVDCSTPICPKCMVMCEVGNRCQSCTSRFESHLLKVSRGTLIRVAIVSAAAGLVLSWAGQSTGGGFFGWIILFVGGFFLGKVIHRVAEYKSGSRITPVVVTAMLVGMLLCPDTISAVVNLAMGATGFMGFFWHIAGNIVGIFGALVPLNSLRTR